MDEIDGSATGIGEFQAVRIAARVGRDPEKHQRAAGRDCEVRHAGYRNPEPPGADARPALLLLDPVQAVDGDETGVPGDRLLVRQRSVHDLDRFLRIDGGTARVGPYREITAVTGFDRGEGVDAESPRQFLDHHVSSRLETRITGIAFLHGKPPFKLI